MSIGIFRKPYVIRRHGAQTVKNGYASATYFDSITRLNVQPQAPDNMESAPEGGYTVKRLKSWGNQKLTSSDDFEGIPGDRLFYDGLWYECTSSVKWNHTILRHYQSDFVLLPADEQTEPPEVKL